MIFGDFVEKTQRYLQGLSCMHPIFERWVSLGKKSFMPISQDYADISEHILAMTYKRENFQEYFFLDSRRNITNDSLSILGFASSFYTYDASSIELMRSTRHGGVAITFRSIGATASNLRSSIDLEFPENDLSELHEADLIKEIIRWTVDVWSPRSCHVISKEFIEAYQGKFKFRELYATWMTYVDFPPLKYCLPADLPCPYEIMPDGGLLFTLTPERPSADNPEDVERGRKLQSIFESLHLCQAEHVLNGWPYAPLESEYKTQITGAPADRAYVVKMAYFDGYDAKRDVLLFASLLQSLSPYLLDFEKYDRVKFPFYEDQIEKNAYVLEARRQMDAVHLAGASTPIEWHIGVEENYEKLCRLFEMADIDGDRISLHFTPYVGS